MLTVAEAQQQVLNHARRLPAAPAALGPSLLGLVLAEDVVSDLDMPPYDKALMDGFALRSADLTSAAATLQVIEEIHAGRPPSRSLGPGQAARIMTGAMIPAGADAVVQVERTEPAGHMVRILEAPRSPGQNILLRGTEMRRGEIILHAGVRLRPQELGLLAALGIAHPRVYRRPRLAVLSTGDEVVEPDQPPGPGQIRNSNASMLLAQAARAGAETSYLGIAGDALDSLRPLVAAGLASDILVLSGGVSAGKRDLVPPVLQEAGVEPVFHKVAMKPGKPVFFGRKEETLVFGLPGNPVSALVGFELFVRPAVRVLMGWPGTPFPLLNASLKTPFPYRTDRPTYHPARLERTAAGWEVELVPWFGSPDLRALGAANAFAILEAGDHSYRQGDPLQVLAPELE